MRHGGQTEIRTLENVDQQYDFLVISRGETGGRTAGRVQTSLAAVTRSGVELHASDDVGAVGQKLVTPQYKVFTGQHRQTTSGRHERWSRQREAGSERCSMYFEGQLPINSRHEPSRRCTE